MGIIGTSASALLVIIAFNLLLKYHLPTIEFFDYYVVDFLSSRWHNEDNMFLQGLFDPVSLETIRLLISDYEGSIPSGLSGLYLRVGPNPIKDHFRGKGYHLFDGHGMIHSLRLQDNKMFYSSQFHQIFVVY